MKIGLIVLKQNNIAELLCAGIRFFYSARNKKAIKHKETILIKNALVGSIKDTVALIATF